MNRIILIGNGFDLSHDLKTSYSHFIHWYLKKVISETDDSFRSGLCSVTMSINCSLSDLYKKFSNDRNDDTPQKTLEFLHNEKKNFIFKEEMFLKRICENLENKGWVDIEVDYYDLLKENKSNVNICKSLNKQLLLIQHMLVQYLKEVQKVITEDTKSQKKEYIFNSSISPNDISVEWEDKMTHLYQYWNDPENDVWKPIKTMVLSFNYTNTVELYTKGKSDFILNQIHGKLDDESSVIFGYGDELDKDYKEMLESDDSELIKNNKTVRYLEANNYRELLQFVESAPFQIYILGHSCGISDRTLLHTIFEHPNCMSIKPFLYEKSDGTDNFLEMIQNISRSIIDKRLMRDRVVNKTQCTTY